MSEDTTLREAAKETLARDSGDEAESARLKRFADALAAKFNPEGNDGN